MDIKEQIAKAIAEELLGSNEGDCIASSLIGHHVVVRSGQSGVWFGLLEQARSDSVLLTDARRAWSWEGALSCSELAAAGPSGGKICTPVGTAAVFGVCEILCCEGEAIERWCSA